MLNSSVWPKDRILQRASPQGQSGPGSNDNDGVLHISQSSITGASPSDYLMSCSGHSLRAGFNPLQRNSRCILQPQPTGPQDTYWRCLTLLQRSSRWFYSPSRLGHKTLIGGVLLFCRETIGDFTAPADGPQDTYWWCLTPLQRSSRCFYRPSRWATGHLLVVSYSSAEKQSVLSTAPADWAIVHSLSGWLILLQK